jgi:hypothetical protein
MMVEELFASLGIQVDASSFAAANAALTGVQKGLIGIGLAAGGIALGLTSAIKRVADAGDKVDELSQQVGVNAQELQRMAYGAQFSGVSIDDLAQAMGFLAKKGVKDLRGGMINLANEFAAMPDGGTKTAMALEKLGRAGKSLIPFLNEGGEALAKFGEEADLVGYVMGEQLVADSAAFNDSIDKLSSTFTGLRNAIVGPLLGPLREVVESFRGWLLTNRRLISSMATKAVAALGLAFKAVGVILKPVMKAIGWVTSNAIRMRVVLVTLATVLAAKFAVAIGLVTTLTALTTAWGQASLLAGARAALAPLVAAAPWVLLLGILGLVIEDIAAALLGGRSFFAEWTTFLQSDPSDGPFMRGLKAILRTITDIGAVFDKLGNSGIGKWLTETNESGFARARKGQLTEYEKANRMFGYDPANPDGMILPALRTNTPGVGSQIPAMLRPNTATLPMSQAPFVPVGGDRALPNVTVGGITINVPSGDPKMIAKSVREVLAEEFSAAAGGVD